MKRINKSWLVSLILALVLGFSAAAGAQDVTIALGSEPTTLDPQLREDGGERAVNDNIYETLMVRTPDGKLAAGLAAAPPKLVDPQTWEVKLRPGIKFHNGEPFNADAAAPRTANRALLQYLRARLDLIKHKWGLGELVHLGEKRFGEEGLSTSAPKSPRSRDPVEIEAVNTGVECGTTANLESLSVDVIICVHNALDEVRQCLSTVRSTIEDHHTLIVVDDGSDEETARLLRRHSDDDGRVRLLRRNTAGGYTKAANCGIENSTADFVILLNSDTQVPTDWWKKLAGALFQSHRVGIVGPLSNAATWQSVPEINVGGERRAANAMSQGFTVDDMNRIAEACSPAHFPRVGLANGFCLGVRRAVFDAIGLFDEESFPRGYGEENDFCIRAVDAGFEIVIATNCYVYHQESSSYSSALRDKLAQETEKVLLKKYPTARIREAVASCKNNPTLDGVRECFRNHLRDR